MQYTLILKESLNKPSHSSSYFYEYLNEKVPQVESKIDFSKKAVKQDNKLINSNENELFEISMNKNQYNNLTTPHNPNYYKNFVTAKQIVKDLIKLNSDSYKPKKADPLNELLNQTASLINRIKIRRRSTSSDSTDLEDIEVNKILSPRRQNKQKQ